MALLFLCFNFLLPANGSAPASCSECRLADYANERTALVGANGTGKSTLLKVLAGSESLDYGALQRTRGMTIGYLPQEGLELTRPHCFR